MLETVCPSLKHLLTNVLHTNIGICAREIELVQGSTGKPALEKKRNVAIDDRFKLKIPISDQLVTWEVVFNCSFPNCPPDFDLNDSDFFASITLDSMEELLPSLNNWDHTKDNALINVIKELRSAYLKYQVEKLESIDNRCAYEYASLVKDQQVPTDHVEVYVDSNNVARFLIKLDVDLPRILPSTVSDDYIMALAIRYGALGSMRSTSLYTSPSVVSLIGTNLELPRNIKSDESLSEYAEEVVKAIENQVLILIVRRQKKRREYIFNLLKHQGQSVLSYDALEYTNASFMLEMDGFQCVAEVTLPTLFPSKPPQVRLLSIYCATVNDQSYSQTLDLPFSENWDVPTMVEQALSLIKSKKILGAFRDQNISLFQLPE